MPRQPIPYTMRYRDLQGLTLTADNVSRMNTINSGNSVAHPEYPVRVSDSSIVTIMAQGANFVTFVNKNAEYAAAEAARKVESLPPEAPILQLALSGDRTAYMYYLPVMNNATNYQYTLDGGNTYTNFSPSDTVSPNAITGLTNGVPITVQIRSYDTNGYSGLSLPLTVTPSTPALPLPWLHLDINNPVCYSGGSRMSNLGTFPFTSRGSGVPRLTGTYAGNPPTEYRIGTGITRNVLAEDNLYTNTSVRDSSGKGGALSFMKPIITLGEALGQGFVVQNNLLSTSSNMTVSLWVNVPQLPPNTSNGFFGMYTSTIQMRIQFIFPSPLDPNPDIYRYFRGLAFGYNDKNSLLFATGSDPFVASNSSLGYILAQSIDNVVRPGVWQHLTAIFSDITNTCVFLVNGVPVDVKSIVTETPNSLANRGFGKLSARSTPFGVVGGYGEFAMVKGYTSNLTASQVYDDFTADRASFGV